MNSLSILLGMAVFDRPVARRLGTPFVLEAESESFRPHAG